MIKMLIWCSECLSLKLTKVQTQNKIKSESKIVKDNPLILEM